MAADELEVVRRVVVLVVRGGGGGGGCKEGVYEINQANPKEYVGINDCWLI